ncbi:MAG: MarR family transcriptional regulator [Propionibacteriaceae bacterium]|jgi:DNA-binding MarR family transcriptional regulator|nr:MarR family transcriptional regulator [Propionibacteriaceae bacterium]
MDAFEGSLNDLLVDTFDAILKYESRSLTSLLGGQVTIAEAHMLAYIARQQNQATVSKIAAGLKIAVPTTTIAVKKLQQKGYVTKVPCAADGRRSYICLTKQGERIDRAHSIFHQRMVRSISNQLKPSEKEVLLAVIDKLNAFFSETKAKK